MIHRQLNRGVALLAGLLLLAAGAPASAALFTIEDIIDVSLTLSGGQVEGEFRPVWDASGIPGIPNAGGSNDTSLFDVFVVDYVADAISADVEFITIAPAAVLFEPLGAGFIIGGGLQAPDSVSVSPLVPGLGTATFGFGQGSTGIPANINQGETTTRLFITYTAGSLDSSLGGPVQFMVGSGTFDDVTGVLVPEPGTLLLVGATLGSFAAARRLRRRDSFGRSGGL